VASMMCDAQSIGFVVVVVVVIVIVIVVVIPIYSWFVRSKAGLLCFIPGMHYLVLII
jgi:hypothetical protein